MNTLPPITNDRAIDWLNEQLPDYPLLSSNIALAAYLVIQTNQPLQDWIRAHFNGLTPAQALNGFWSRAIIAATAYGGLDATHVPSDDEFNRAEQALKARILPRIPADWQPTPRAPEAPGPGDMTNILTNPIPPTLTDDQLRAAVRARGWELIERPGIDLTRHIDYVLCPPALQSGTGTYHGYLEQEVRDPNDAGRLWTSTLPPMPAWLPKLQTPMSAAVVAGAVRWDPFKEVRRPTGPGGELKWYKPTWADAPARNMTAEFLGLAWVQANYPDLPKLLQRYGY